MIPQNQKEPAYSIEIQGSGELTYELSSIENGTYTMRVSKAKHVTREYTVVVSDADVVQDVKIHLRGDISGDGKVNMVDLAKINSYLCGVSNLNEYEVKCADVTGDNKLSLPDLSKVNSYLQGAVESL